MNILELKVPPLLLFFVAAALMWCLSHYWQWELASSQVVHVASALLFMIGVIIALAGVYAFKKQKTTVNPTTPEKATSLVTTGVYRFTRNPMYAGFLFWLLGLAIYFSSVAALLGPVLFVLYMNEFQIKPEERALSAKFGQEFTCYTQEVRRWL